MQGAVVQEGTPRLTRENIQVTGQSRDLGRINIQVMCMVEESILMYWAQE